MVYFQTWGIWKSGCKKIDLIIVNLTEGNIKHTIKDRRFLRITLGVHSLPNRGQHPANNCSWQNPSITAESQSWLLWDKPVMAPPVPQPAVFQNVQGQRPPKCMKHTELWKQGSLCVHCGLLKIWPRLGPSWMFLLLLSPNRIQTSRIKMLCCGKKCQKDILR